MPTDQEPLEEPLEERIKKCPIHQWTNVDRYLEKAHVPHHLWEPFHEVVITRGKYPWNINPEDAKKFGKEAREITLKYEVTPEEGQPFLQMFQQLTSRWIQYRSRLN